MVFYMCPNCYLKTPSYQQSLLHYESCTVVRARSNSEPTIIAPPLHSIPLANLRLNTTAINSIFHKRSLLATSVPLPLSPAIINITTAPSSSYTTSQNSTQSVKFNKALS